MTLLELAIAAAVLVIALSGLAAALLGSVSATRLHKAQTVALHDAKAVLEELSNLNPVGQIGVPCSLLEEANAINLGQPSLCGATQIQTPQSLPGESYNITVQARPVGGGATYVPAQITPAFADPIEIIVAVTWFQGRRPVTVQARIVRNVL